MMRALALVAVLFVAPAVSRAALNVSGVNPQPPSLSSGQNITVIISVNNSGASAVLNVSTTVQSVGAGGASTAIVVGPTPVATAIASSGSASFTWVYQSSGCGQVAFSAWATGYDTASSTTITSAPGSGGPVLVVCTPSPTPTITPTSTPTPIVSATPTFTATPWIVYVNPPTTGDASIPGNLFHPNEGQPLQLKFDAPAEGVINIDLYNRLGQRVRSITRSVQPGSYTELWDGRSDQGLLVASGIYVAQFRGKGLFKTVKFAVIK